MPSTKLSSCVGYEELTDNSGAVQILTPPSDASWAIISVDPAGVDMRWRDDGTSPSTSSGHVLASPAGAAVVLSPPIIYKGDLDNLRFIRNGGSGTATISISYYTGSG